MIRDDKQQRFTVVPRNPQGQTVLKSVVDQLPVSARPIDGRFVLSSNPGAILDAIRKCRALENDWPEMHYLWSVHPFMEWTTDKIRMSFGRLEAPAIWLPLAAGKFSYLVTVLWPNRKGVTIFQRWYLVTGKAKGDFQVSPFEGSDIYRRLCSNQLPNKERTADLLELVQDRVPQAVIKAQEHAHEDRKSFEASLQTKLNKHLSDLEELQQRQEVYIEETYQVDRGIKQVQLSLKERELNQVRSRFSEFQEWIKFFHDYGSRSLRTYCSGHSGGGGTWKLIIQVWSTRMSFTGSLLVYDTAGEGEGV